jgi:hypothetical protein
MEPGTGEALTRYSFREAIRPKKKPPATGRRGLEFAKTDSPLALFIVVAISQLQDTEHKSIHVALRIPPERFGFKNQ